LQFLQVPATAPIKHASENQLLPQPHIHSWLLNPEPEISLFELSGKTA
jgi:hypothetical protein